MTDIIISIASRVAEYLVPAIGRQLGYLFSYRSNVEDLRSQLEKLGDVNSMVERDVDAATRIIGHKIEPVVEEWQKNVDGITEEAGKFLDDVDKAKKRCFNGLYPNLKSRYQLSKKAKKTTQEVVKIQGEGKFDRVSYDTFESRMSILKKVMEALKDPSVNMIGVYGMGGVGKTMLVKEVYKKAEEDKLFDKVVMAVVSQTPNTRNIQGEIADKLGLRFDQETESGRANGLCERLKKEKSILVILDDIWAKLDLGAVGIPFGDYHKRCTILVTSRSQDTCNENGVQKNFLVGVLSEKEAWNLFKEKAGDSVEATDLKPTAIEVAKECAGLPIAIVTVAIALKNMSLPVWKNALQELRRSTPKNIEGMHAKVYSTLERSYNSLESEEAKSLFLLCSLHQEDSDISIKDLLRYGMGLGLFQNIYTLEEGRNKVDTLVHNLKASCLLLDGKTTQTVKMHDVVRDVGIYVASKDKNMLIVRNGVELEEWTEEKIQRNCQAISLPYSDIHELPTGLECPELKLLLLSKYRSLKIPDTFFEGMKQLKVLNLTNMCFSSLPSSIHFLTNLQTLCLDQCVLRDITIIGELKKLEILSVQNSDIEKLPRERGQLTRLRMVEVKGCGRLKNLFSLSMARSLLQLEEIEITECKIMDEIVAEGREEAEDNNEPMDKIMFPQLRSLTLERLPELMSFYSKVKKMPSIPVRRQKLSATDAGSEEIILEGEHDIPIPFFNEKVSFPNLEKLVIKGIFMKEIWHYQLSVGSFCKLKYLEVAVGLCLRLRNIFTTSIAKSLVQLQELSIKRCEMVEEIIEKEGVEEEATDKIVFPQLTSLTLFHLWKLKSFCQGIHVSEWPSLKILVVFACYYDVEIFASEVISSEETRGKSHLGTPTKQPLFLVDKVAFPNLEELELRYLFRMKEIWQGQFHAGSIYKLRVLKVIGCYEILKVFPFTLLQNLQNLEELTVHQCYSLEEVFEIGGVADEVGHAATLPQLRELREEIIEIGGVADEVGHAATLPQLRELRLTKLPKLMHLWKNDSQLSPTFQNLATLEVRSCGSLTHLLPSTIAKSLVQIKNIIVDDCKMVKEIIGIEEGEATDDIIFSQLNTLELANLPNLTSFCKGTNAFLFPSLEKVLVEECPKLKTFSNGILITPELEKVQVQKYKWIWESDLNTTIQHLFIQK